MSASISSGVSQVCVCMCVCVCEIYRVRHELSTHTHTHTHTPVFYNPSVKVIPPLLNTVAKLPVLQAPEKFEPDLANNARHNNTTQTDNAAEHVWW